MDSERSQIIVHWKTSLGHFAGAAATMLGYNGRRALAIPARSLEQVATKSWELAPGVDEPYPTICISESHFGRILGSAPPYQSVASVTADIRRDRHYGGPTRAFLLRDALLFRQHVYCGLYRGDLYSTLGWQALRRAETGELSHSILATTYSGTRWFGHFLHDELPLQELVSSLGVGVGHLRPTYKHEPGWRAVLGVKAPPSYASLRVRELVLIDDCGQNPAKRSRYLKLRSRLTGFPRGHDRIFLRRSRSRGSDDRHIVNSEEVEERLVQEGFHVVDTGQITVDEMLKRCMGASIVVSVDGSHAAPSFYFGRRGACLLFIYPPKRVSVLLPRLAQFYGMIGAMFIAEPVSGSDSEFRVDPDELMREIDVCCRARTVANPNPGAIWPALDCGEDRGGPCRAAVDANIGV
jgi:hypothetical protein